MKTKEFWYLDSWYGNKKTFPTLREAKKSAKEEYGVSIAVYNEKGKLVCFAKASGFTPA